VQKKTSSFSPFRYIPCLSYHPHRRSDYLFGKASCFPSRFPPSPRSPPLVIDRQFTDSDITSQFSSSTVQTLQQSNRQSSLDSTSTRTSLDSSRYNSSHPARHSSHGHSRSQGSRTPHRSHSHPQPVIPAVPAQPAVRPNVLTRLNTNRTMLANGSRSQPASPIGGSPYVSITHSGQAPFVSVKPAGGANGGYDPYTGTRYVTYGH
jgi:hypothetical protein